MCQTGIALLIAIVASQLVFVDDGSRHEWSGSFVLFQCKIPVYAAILILEADDFDLKIAGADGYRRTTQEA